MSITFGFEKKIPLILSDLFCFVWQTKFGFEESKLINKLIHQVCLLFIVQIKKKNFIKLLKCIDLGTQNKNQ